MHQQIFCVEVIKNSEMIMVFFRSHSCTKHAICLLPWEDVLNKYSTGKFFCFQKFSIDIFVKTVADGS